MSIIFIIIIYAESSRRFFSILFRYLTLHRFSSIVVQPSAYLYQVILIAWCYLLPPRPRKLSSLNSSQGGSFSHLDFHLLPTSKTTNTPRTFSMLPIPRQTTQTSRALRPPSTNHRCIAFSLPPLFSYVAIVVYLFFLRTQIAFFPSFPPFRLCFLPHKRFRPLEGNAHREAHSTRLAVVSFFVHSRDSL